MSVDILLSNALNPPILFFFLGVLAILFRSDLEVPQPLPKLFSLFLLLAIGFRGGVELRDSGLNATAMLALAAAVVMALLVPAYSFFILRTRLSIPDSAAIAATYGSVSAVTFIAATSFLSKLEVPFGGHMVAAMAIMESPAIIVGVALAAVFAPGASGKPVDWHRLAREAFLNGSVFLLVGSLLIGALTGHEGEKALKPFIIDIFKGVLCLFLLDLGLVSGRRLGDLKKLGVFPVAFAVVVPLVNALLAIAISRALGLAIGDAYLLTVLCASASYIAVPAAVRTAIPDANPGVYVTMALAVTFPFNIIAGLPLYMMLINRIWS